MNIRYTASAALLLCVSVARAQAYGPVILRLPSDARVLALGNTGITSRDDAAVFYNPAQLAVASGFGVSGEWLDTGAGTGSMSAVTRFNGTGGIGIGARFANFDTPAGGFPVDRATMLGGGALPGTAFEASIGGAQVVKKVRVGVAIKYAEEMGGTERIGRVLGDVGLSKDMLRSTFGLSVQNIGRDMTAAAGNVLLPIKSTFGASQSRSFGPFDFNGVAAISMIRTDAVQGSGGVEMNYSWLSGYNVVLRGGARSRVTGEQPLTAGAGFTMDRLTIDYALETLDDQRVAHRFGVRIR